MFPEVSSTENHRRRDYDNDDGDHGLSYGGDGGGYGHDGWHRLGIESIGNEGWGEGGLEI